MDTWSCLICPVHGGPLEKVEITQGDDVLGWVYVCPQHEWGSKKGECEYLLDTDKEGKVILESEEA